MKKVLFLFGFEQVSFKNKKKIILKLILMSTMRKSHQKNYSTALRKFTASAIGSVFIFFSKVIMTEGLIQGEKSIRAVYMFSM